MYVADRNYGTCTVNLAHYLLLRDALEAKINFSKRHSLSLSLSLFLSRARDIFIKSITH